MTGTVLLALIAAGTLPAAHLLSRACWTWRTPRTAIALWQALGLAWGVATIGALLGFALLPYRLGVAGGLVPLSADQGARLDIPHLVALVAGLSLGSVLLVMLVYAVVRVVRARHRHRALLALVARDSGLRDTLVLDHDAAAAYCVPGVRSAKVVVSAGTLKLLDQAELAAVLAHERAHVRERHDLVLLPFASLRQVFPGFRLVARSMDAVELLIEMTADDRARRHRPPRELATALLRFAAARPVAAPSGALAALGTAAETGSVGRTASADPFEGGGPVMARVRRLLEPAPPPFAVQATALAFAILIAVIPVLLYALPI
ncbi:MAG: peptidase Ste24p [Actinomycetia bacterium]|nr:peptidase Ste24p [Actinomycetes bacterium]